MLTVDLTRLERFGRLTIEEDLPPDFPLWEGADFRPLGPIEVRLEVQRVGADVLVRGHLRGTIEFQCRRCLEPVVHGIDEPVTFLFRSGLDPVEAEREEVYPIPAGERELDLTDAVREHLMLAIPDFVVCRAECRGLCPRCGVNLNEGTCTCEEGGTDERWGPLRGLKLD
jgi:uncharacterized protein